MIAVCLFQCGPLSGVSIASEVGVLRLYLYCNEICTVSISEICTVSRMRYEIRTAIASARLALNDVNDMSIRPLKHYGVF